MSYFSCIIIRDGERTVGETISSLINQTIQPRKIIVVNDGSTDNTGNIIETYRKNHPELIEVINTENKTRDYTRLPRLRTEAVEYGQAHGCKECNYLMTTGGDCIFEPAYAEKIIAAMESDPKLVLVSGDYGSMSTSPHGAGRFIRASFFNEYRKKYPLRAWQESELKMRALHMGYKIAVLSNASFEHLDNLGHSHNFVGWGRVMKALGYSRAYVWGRFALEILVPRRIGRKGAMRMLWTYLTYSPEESGYYSLCEPELRKAVAKMQRERIRLLLRRKLKAIKMKAFSQRRTDTLLLPVQFSHRFKNAGVEGGIAYVELDNGRKLYGYKSKKNAAEFYYSVAKRLPSILTADTYGCAVDVSLRYLKDLPYPRTLLPDRGGTIAEIGAYLGHKTIKFVDDVVGNEGQVLAVEMMPDNFAILERNIRENNIKNVVLKQIGVWNEKQTKEVIGATQQQNSLVTLDDRPSFMPRGVVRTDTLDNILKEWNAPVVDFLNIRVNGAEIEVIQGLSSELNRVKVIFIAAQYTREGQKTIVKIKELLREKECKIVREDNDGIYAVTKQYSDQKAYSGIETK